MVAKKKFQKWVRELRTTSGARDFRYVRVSEHGAFGDNVHFHVLVGGLNPGTHIAHWAKRWEVLAGEAIVQWYDAEKKGIWYMLKTLRQDEDFDIEVFVKGALEAIVDDENN